MNSKRVNEIDLLRFIAALAVVFFHYAFRGHAADNMTTMPYPMLASVSKYGYLGVQLFFMISGFVILMTAANGSLKGFVISRASRLYPAFWACCTLTFCVTIFIGEPRYQVYASQYLFNLTMFSDFIGGVPPIDGVYWSLFVELRFYALIAIILIIGKIHHAQSFVVLWLIASIALEIKPVSGLNYALITEYSAFFIAGSTFFLIWSKGPSITKITIILLSWCLATFQSISELERFRKHFDADIDPYVVAGVVTSSYACMLMISLKKTAFLGRHPWLLAGSITYPLYLVHQNIGYMLFNIAHPHVSSHLIFWGTIAAAILLAYVVHRVVERKFSTLIKSALLRVFENMEAISLSLRKRAEERR